MTTALMLHESLFQWKQEHLTVYRLQRITWSIWQVSYFKS